MTYSTDEDNYIKDMVDSGIIHGSRAYTETLNMYRYYNEQEKNKVIIYGLQEQLNIISIIVVIMICILVAIGGDTLYASSRYAYPPIMGF